MWQPQGSHSKTALNAKITGLERVLDDGNTMAGST
jgi:hypothetical protein